VPPRSPLHYQLENGGAIIITTARHLQPLSHVDCRRMSWLPRGAVLAPDSLLTRNHTTQSNSKVKQLAPHSAASRQVWGTAFLTDTATRLSDAIAKGDVLMRHQGCDGSREIRFHTNPHSERVKTRSTEGDDLGDESEWRRRNACGNARASTRTCN
jgi:hypothetical protein